MTSLVRQLTTSRVSLFVFAVAALGLLSWACSSSPDPVDPTAITGLVPTNTIIPEATTPLSDTPSPESVEPTATAGPVPTTTIIPEATTPPSDTPSPESTPSAPPTNRDWNILGPLDASVTIADFGDFQ